MNIFVTSISPLESAINLDDKRVKHMPLECFELISMAYYKNTGICIAPFIIWNRKERADNPIKFNELYNHRCTNWVASKRENMNWLWLHANALLLEHYYRFGYINQTEHLFDSIKHYIPAYNFSTPTTFVNATPFNEKTVFDSYKKVLNYKWYTSDEVKPIKWTNRGKPSWAKEPIEQIQQALFYNDAYNDLPF
jgi:hypothetical protein